MEAIKNSRIIVILLILYIFIAIVVVTMDKTQKKDNSGNNSNSSEKTNDEMTADEFIDDVNNLYDEILSYASDEGITANTCVLLDRVRSGATGSAYIENGGSKITLWYSKESYVINNFEITNYTLTKDDIESSFTTDYYSSCGLSE